MRQTAVASNMKKTLLILIILFSFELYSQEIIKFSDAEFEFCLTKKCGETNCEITKIEVLKNGILKQTIKPSENWNYYIRQDIELNEYYCKLLT